MGLAMAGRRLVPLILGDLERFELTSLAARRKTAQAMAMRARIVPACAEDQQNKEVHLDLGGIDRGAGDHRVGDAGQRRYGCGNGAARIAKPTLGFVDRNYPAVPGEVKRDHRELHDLVGRRA
jgi:hypothetical protein